MKKSFLSRKEEIILTTVTLIHEMGINQVSMKEIGKREGVSEASLYKHFKNKGELIMGVLEHYKQYDGYIYSTFQKDHDVAGNIQLFFRVYAEYYQNYKEITSLLGACDTLLHDEAFAKVIREIDEEKFKFMTELVKTAQEDGEILDIISPKELSCILLGTFYQLIRMWRQWGYSFDLKDKVNGIISSIVEVYEEKRR